MGRRRAPVLAAIDDQLVGSGLQPDRHSLKELLWEHAVNVVFWNGTVKRKIPAGLAYDTGAALPIRGLSQQYSTTGSRWLWSAAGSKILRWQFGAPETIDADFGDFIEDATAIDRPTIYDFTHYGDWTIINSGIVGEAPKIHKPGDSYGVYANAPVGAVRFLKKMSFMVALGYGARGTQVGWSDANNIDLWTAAADNSAGSLAIDEFSTPIRAGAVLGDAISVYSEDQLALVRYIGLPFNFGQRTVLDGIGAIGKAAVASDMRVNVGVGRAGIWWTDGNSGRYIDEGYLSDYLQNEVNWEQGAKIVAARNDFTGCFEFHFPMRDSLDINEAWSWDPRVGSFSPCPPASFMDERRLFNHPVHGSNDGKVLLTDFDPDAAAPLELRTKPLVMQSEQSPHTAVRIDEFDLLLHKAENVQVRYGCSDEPEGTYEWSTWLDCEAGAKIYQVPAGDDSGAPLPENPYHKLEFRSVPEQTNWDFDLQGFLLYGVTTGTKM